MMYLILYGVMCCNFICCGEVELAQQDAALTGLEPGLKDVLDKAAPYGERNIQNDLAQSFLPEDERERYLKLLQKYKTRERMLLATHVATGAFNFVTGLYCFRSENDGQSFVDKSWVKPFAYSTLTAYLVGWGSRRYRSRNMNNLTRKKQIETNGSWGTFLARWSGSHTMLGLSIGMLLQAYEQNITAGMILSPIGAVLSLYDIACVEKNIKLIDLEEEIDSSST